MATRVGILGGGQLSRMLVESADRMGLRPIVFAANASEPAAQVCPGAFFGSSGNEASLRSFFNQCDQVIFENEFLEIPVLRQASAGLRIRFTPSLEVMEKFQDKLIQKEILVLHKIPTADFEVWNSSQESSGEWLNRVRQKWRDQFVLKWSRGGYDGKGTWIAPGDEASALHFIEEGTKKSARIYAEEKIPFVRELALVSFAGRATGEFQSLPLVISQQEKGICRWVQGPATALGVSLDTENQARQIAQNLVMALGLEGAFAIEWFETADGKLWVNEIAPRVHNSGHFSMTACLASQFENHWRSVLGLPMGEARSFPFFAMWNLLGPASGMTTPLRNVSPPEASAGIQLHWYGKSEMRSGRKMGHLNTVAFSRSELESVVHRMKEQELKWLKNLNLA